MILKKILEPYLAKILFRQVIASPSVFHKNNLGADRTNPMSR
jgi:hypothetical protein